MGSGNNNRKKKDSPFIRRPKKVFSTGIGTIDIGEIAAQICIPSFEKKVIENPLTKEGVSVYLKKRENTYYIMISGTEIGYLNGHISQMVSECTQMGVRYKGVIILKNKKPYARFDRISK